MTRPILKYLVITALFFVAVFSAAAQQGNIWYFGNNAGISFNPGASPTLPYGVPGSAMSADEGCASICDNNGQIMFYTNGKVVYNRENKVMFNGDGLLGHKSSFQSAIIIQKPNSETLFYIFTSDALENNFSNGYRYSIVDMDGDGGKGAVTLKNQVMGISGTERLTAAKHANGVDVWIITNDRSSNTFRAWQLNCSGLAASPVVSNVGDVLDQQNMWNIGCIKVSPDGKQLCQTHFDEGDDLSDNHFFQLFSFNNATGVISNPIKISLTGRKLYVNEFSPNSSLLYLTDPNRPQITQVECKLPTAAAIAASAYTIPAAAGMFGLQAGPDGKVYVARYGLKLGVINNPDVKGAGCNMDIGGVELSHGNAQIAFPAFINTAFNDPANGFSWQIVDTCGGQVRFTSFAALSGTLQYEWDFGDGNTSNQQNPLHTYAQLTQSYKVKLRISSAQLCGKVSVEKTVIPGGIIANLDFRIDAICDSSLVRITNLSTFTPVSAANYTWTFGDNTNPVTDPSPSHQYTNPGNYQIKLQYNASPACLSRSISKPFFNQPINLVVTPNQEINEGETLQLSATGNANVFRWSPPWQLSDTSVSNPLATPYEDIIYIVKASNTSGCKTVDSVRITVKPIREIFIPDAFTPNGDGVNDYLKPVYSRQLTRPVFQVFNRWGQLVFASVNGDVGKGWDGRLKNGEPVPGVYVWQFTALNKQGVAIKRRGTVILIR
jgi:gliding motility-associated-like protein